jgi:V8-like Glu-specific endopeptidase
MKFKLVKLLGITPLLMMTLPIAVAQSQVREPNTSKGIVSQDAQPNEADSRAINYANAKTLSREVKHRPTVDGAAILSLGKPGGVMGQAPKISVNFAKAKQLVPAKKIAKNAQSVAPQNYGTLNHPFTTARVATQSSTVNPAVVFPALPAGKLFFKIGTASYVCSASVIKPRVVVTAAHCVSEFGKNSFYSNFTFVPGYTNGNAPVGTWSYKRVYAPQSYLNGTDVCSASGPGVVCANDVAVLVMNDNNAQKIGDVTGTFGYGYNGLGYTSFLRKQASQLTQLGYPVDLDSGALMQRNDSLSFIDAASANNQIIGSLMTGGSSGGPWLINFGVAPSAPNISAGSVPTPNLVVGVTSWGYTSSNAKEMGASPFTDSNIVPLVNQACSADPGNC